MIVVVSLSTTIRLARPRSVTTAFSSLNPTSSEITWPPVTTAMSSSIALRRSPKPGAFTAATLSPPRSRLTSSRLRGGAGVSFDYAQNVGFLQDQPVFAIDDPLGACPFAKHHMVPHLAPERANRAGLVTDARADSKHLALDRFFLCCIGNDDAAGRLLLGFDSFHQNPVVQGSEPAMPWFLSRCVVPVK